jgi:glycosyltransferase involved in cell wall biosynthesis
MSELTGPVAAGAVASGSIATGLIAVVIPCYKVRGHILNVIARIGPEVTKIYVIDDACPEGSGSYVLQSCGDARVSVLTHEQNRGVGGAVMTGYRQALVDGAKVIVKIDGDGQMAPELIPYFASPILSGRADYTKGNRFYDLKNISNMPRLRIFGNAILSFMAKLSTGYWSVFDPTNGYTAIHADVVAHLPLEKISNRFFFETDMLFRLNIIRAVVLDIPMDARYGEEVSNLSIRKVLGEFLHKHTCNLAKRIFYNYFLRDMSIASLELVGGIVLFLFGSIFGAYHWIFLSNNEIPAPAATVMLAALPIVLGLQLILAFLGYDIASVPRDVLHATAPLARPPNHTFDSKK